MLYGMGYERREERLARERKSLFVERPTINVKEDYGIVLDFLPNGHAGAMHRMPIAQLIGAQHLTILEVVPKKDVFLKTREKVYIGPDKRDKIHHISGKIPYDKLTQTAKLELDSIIKEAVSKNAGKIVEFFNKSGPISTRLHQLELVPGIGKKHMWKIIEEREKKPFTDLNDLKERVPLIPDPLKAVIHSVVEELEEKDKYKVLTNYISIDDEAKNN